MENTRTIILHYHLFKNAGTSIDSILQENFGEQWITKEFKSVINNTPEVIQWINENPQAIAFSSHTMNGPIPKIDGVKIISIAMLRDPVKRIISAYKFERMQSSDSWGAQLAKQLSFEEYVVTRLQEERDTQCRNFQTARLATLRPGDEPKIQRAIEALNDLSVVGIVEDFNKSLKKIASKILEEFKEELPIIYSEFHKIVLEQEDYFIEKIENQFICSGELVTNMINISGNKDSVLDEIFIRFEKSVLSREISEMGAIDGDTIVLGNLEFEYKQ